MNSIHAISLKFLTMLKDDQRDFDECLKTLLDMNHHLLNALGVGTVTLDTLLLIAKEHGYSGKLTGAGGGGCVLIYIPPDSKVERLKNILIEKGYDCYEVSMGVPGLSLHETQMTKDVEDIVWMQSPKIRSCTDGC
jgi:mevalonate kinase